MDLELFSVVIRPVEQKMVVVVIAPSRWAVKYSWTSVGQLLNENTLIELPFQTLRCPLITMHPAPPTVILKDSHQSTSSSFVPVQHLTCRNELHYIQLPSPSFTCPYSPEKWCSTCPEKLSGASMQLTGHKNKALKRRPFSHKTTLSKR